MEVWEVPVVAVWLASELQTDRMSLLLLQLPREWGDSVARQGCTSSGPYSVPVAPAGARNGRHGKLQSRRPQGAWLLVRRRDPEKKGDSHSKRDLCQDYPWVRFLGATVAGVQMLLSILMMVCCITCPAEFHVCLQ